VSLRDASFALWSQFHGQPWFVAVGEGVNDQRRPCLILYVKRKTRTIGEPFNQGWMGYDVLLKEVGTVGPTGPVGPAR
jgi:hypothetical protein